MVSGRSSQLVALRWSNDALRCGVIASFGIASIGLASTEAHADAPKGLDPIELPTLPSLTHRDFTSTFQIVGAGIGVPPNAKGGSSSVAYAWLTHLDGEYPIEPRHWFFGTAWDLASGTVPSIGRELLYGNPELWVRGVWSNRSGLSAGGSFGFVLPLPRDLTRQGRGILHTITVVRPWDSSYFTDRTLTARPALDIRLVANPFLFQLRQGLDLAYSFADGRSDVTARTAVYAGLDLAHLVGLGLEFFEVYPITAEIPDDKRAAFTFSPSIRFRLPQVEPGISVLLPLNTPLGGTASSFVAVRLNVSFALERFPEPVIR